MKKIYILDTNVLIHDPKSIFKFEDNDLVIPIVVLEELDKLEKGNDEAARNAREATRVLDSFRSLGKLSEGYPLDGGGMLKVEVNHQDQRILPLDLPFSSADNRILSVARYLHISEAMKEENAILKKKVKVILVTKDTNLRVKADAIGIEAQDYRNDKVSVDSLYTGFSGKDIPNSFDHGNGKVYRRLPSGEMVTVKKEMERVMGLQTRNIDQSCAVDLLRDKTLPIIALVGGAGTGKTLLAVAVGAEMTRRGDYSRLIVTRPIVPLGGRDLGYLPGTVEEKMSPWMKAINNTLDFLEVGNDGKTDIDVEIQPLAYIRGLSLRKAYVVVDEAQNLTPHEMKTVVTRIGEGAKIVLTGDPSQIDHPYLDSGSNGLSYLVEKFKGDEDFGTVTLTKGERSKLAEKAARLL